MVDKKREPECRNLSRRDFVRGTSKAAAGVVLGLNALGQSSVEELRRYPRVARAYDQNATAWDYQSNYYFDFIDQAAVDQMLIRGLQALMRARSLSEACRRLIPYYQPGEKIAIKINLNNIANQSNEIDATAPVLNALLLVLTSSLGVQEGDVYVYDVSRPVPAFRIRNRVPWNVNYVQSGDALAQADYSAPIDFRNINTQYCPLVLTQASHLIDLCLFKDHLFVLATMGMKNHFGTTRPDPDRPTCTTPSTRTSAISTPPRTSATRLD